MWAESEPEPNILWNAPGVPFPFEPSRHLLVRRALSRVRYAAVRDEVSRDYLLEAGVEEPVHVSPDTGILLAELIRKHLDGEKARALLEERGVRPDGRGLLCFQCAPGFLRSEEVLVAKSLARIAARRNLEVVLLPIGWCHGDQDALRLVQRAGGDRFTLVEGLGSPLEVGAVIGACDYFVGSSLHGNLTALSFGIPHIVVNNPSPSVNLEGLVRLARLEEFRINDWGDLEGGFDRLVATTRERWTAAGDLLKSRASEHFDRLAELILRSATERRELNGMGHKPGTASDGDIPLGVYATMAELHRRLDDERAARRATEEELLNKLHSERLAHSTRLERSEARNKDLKTQLERHRARIGNLETQVQRLKTRNENLSKSLREMEEATIWRLFGPYRWLRARIEALAKPASQSREGDETTPPD